MKEYFPVDVVVDRITSIYQHLLGVTFFRVPDEQTWHPEAQQYAAWDSAAVEDARADKGEGFLGCTSGFISVSDRKGRLTFRYRHAPRPGASGRKVLACRSVRSTRSSSSPSSQD